MTFPIKLAPRNAARTAASAAAGAEPAPPTPFWLSFVAPAGWECPHRPSLPVWCTGYTGDDFDKPTIVMAFRAPAELSETQAIAYGLSLVDLEPGNVRIRFCEVCPSDWRPFTKRFQEEPGMSW